jgi:pimeloyl-ACP methyl ester carboxylesterase
VNSRTKAALKILLTSLLLLLAVGTVFYLQPLWVNDQLVAFKLRSQNVHSNYVAVDGYRIHYLEAASASGPGIPLLLVHGLGARGEVWAPLIPTLAAQGFHVYAIDLLGFGRSDKPDVDYSMALQQKTVLDFMQAIHLPHAEVIGWSMGGWVALKLALDNPKVVDRLVVFDAAGTYFPPCSPPPTRLASPSWRAALAPSPKPRYPPSSFAPSSIYSIATDGSFTAAWPPWSAETTSSTSASATSRAPPSSSGEQPTISSPHRSANSCTSKFPTHPCCSSRAAVTSSPPSAPRPSCLR